MQVPMFWPMMMGRAIPYVMPPVMDRACKIPTEAAEECSTAVSTAPTATPTKGLVNAVRMEVNSGMSARGLTAFFIIVVPYIRMAKPTMMEPALCFLPVL